MHLNVKWVAAHVLSKVDPSIWIVENYSSHWWSHLFRAHFDGEGSWLSCPHPQRYWRKWEIFFQSRIAFRVLWGIIILQLLWRFSRGRNSSNCCLVFDDRELLWILKLGKHGWKIWVTVLMKTLSKPASFTISLIAASNCCEPWI